MAESTRNDIYDSIQNQRPPAGRIGALLPVSQDLPCLSPSCYLIDLIGRALKLERSMCVGKCYVSMVIVTGRV